MGRARLLAAAAGLALLSACVPKPAPAPEPPPPQPVPPPPPAPVPPPPPEPEDWRDRPLTPGNWYYSRDGAATQALFGPPQSEAHFIVRCEPARRQVVLTVEGVTSRMAIRTGTGARAFATTARPEPLPYSSTSLAASDPFLDAMVFSRGRFTVEAPGLPTLVLPTWPEPARVIEDCRG